MKTSWLIVSALLLASSAYAQETIVAGEAKTQSGGEDAYILEQPSNAPNPLGNPIPDYPFDSAVEESSLMDDSLPKAPVEQKQTNQSNISNQFQNTLEEANGRVYDTQSWPVSDENMMQNSSNPETIYSPNVQ